MFLSPIAQLIPRSATATAPHLGGRADDDFRRQSGLGGRRRRDRRQFMTLIVMVLGLLHLQRYRRRYHHIHHHLDLHGQDQKDLGRYVGHRRHLPGHLPAYIAGAGSRLQARAPFRTFLRGAGRFLHICTRRDKCITGIYAERGRFFTSAENRSLFFAFSVQIVYKCGKK